MKRRPATIILALMLIWGVVPGLTAEPSDNSEVEKKVDEITAGREYDWLRQPADAPGGATQKGAESQRSGRYSRRANSPSEGCGYRVGPAVQPREVEESGCDSDRTPGSCDCEETIGKCDAGSTPGSCQFKGFSGIVSSLGYALAGLLLAAIIFFVASAILSRDKTDSAAALTNEEDVSSPEEMRLTQVPATSTERMMQLAEESAERGDFKQAVGWTYLAGIGSLHRAGQIDLRLSTTNLEIVETVRSKGGPHSSTGHLVRIFEDLFFGERESTSEHWYACRRIVEEELG